MITQYLLFVAATCLSSTVQAFPETKSTVLSYQDVFFRAFPKAKEKTLQPVESSSYKARTVSIPEKVRDQELSLNINGRGPHLEIVHDNVQVPVALFTPKLDVPTTMKPCDGRGARYSAEKLQNLYSKMSTIRSQREEAEDLKPCPTITDPPKGRGAQYSVHKLQAAFFKTSTIRAQIKVTKESKPTQPEAVTDWEPRSETFQSMSYLNIQDAFLYREPRLIDPNKHRLVPVLVQHHQTVMNDGQLHP